MARFFAFFALFHLSLTFFFDRRFPLSHLADTMSRIEYLLEGKKGK